MSLADDLLSEVGQIFATDWKIRDGRDVPTPETVALGNDAVRIDAAVLYADLAESTDLVVAKKQEFAAEIYKTYLRCAARVIQNNNGEITAYDGDRIMGVFVGDARETNAAVAALQVNYCVAQIINPLLASGRPWKTDYQVRHAVGIDTSSLFVAKTGIRGDNDLVWVGRAANYAAKLCALREGVYASWITKEVFDVLKERALYGGTNRKLMWEQRTWKKYNHTVYCSNWHWKP